MTDSDSSLPDLNGDGSKASFTRGAGLPRPTDNNPSTGPGVDGGGSSGDPTIKFNDTANFVDGQHVLDISDNQIFLWSSSEGTTLKSIHLMLVPEDKNDDPEVIVSAPFEESSNRRRQGPTGTIGGDGEQSFFPSLRSDSTGLELELFNTGTLEDAINEVFSIMISWQKPGSSFEGHTYSPFFSVMDSDEDRDEKEKELRDNIKTFGDRAQDGYETTFSPNDELPTWDGKPQREDSVRTGSETGATSVSKDGDDSNGGSGGGGGGGLAPGAIAGIAVGAFVFLCLIAGLAWFLLRRRRNSKPRAGGYSDPSRNVASNAYIVDKIDTSGQSPHSPYSDDGQEQNTPLDPNTHRNYSSPGTAQPFRDDSHLPSQQRSVGGQEGDGAGSPPRQRSESAARDYSHLVEDGMTQDDIRRLEEEERQLDDEIERAGRRR